MTETESGTFVDVDIDAQVPCQRGIFGAPECGAKAAWLEILGQTAECALCEKPLTGVDWTPL